MQDPYQTLKISKTASTEEIKSAYRKLAKEYHPDLNPGNEEVERRFKEISQAYQILGDPEKRKRFDRGEIDASGQETPWKGGFYQQQAGPGFRAKYARSSTGDSFSADNIFSDLFGGRGWARSGPHKGEDVSYSISVSFLDAAKGATKRVRLADGKTLDVRIPAGTEDGQQLRLKGQGRPGAGGGASGDVLVEVNVQSHPHFTRKDRNIYLEVPVTLQEALLGAVITVPTLYGKVSMKIPPGSNTGTTLRLKEKGIAGRGSEKAGDQYIKLNVVLPDKPDQELSDFVKNWGQTHGYDPRRAAGLTEGDER